MDVLIATPPCQGMSVANHKKAENEIVIYPKLSGANFFGEKFYVKKNGVCKDAVFCKAEKC